MFHGFRSVRLAADFAPPVAKSLDPYGVKREPPILSRTHLRSSSQERLTRGTLAV